MHDNVIRFPVLRGQQAVAGLWFPTQRFSDPARRALLLAHWQPGASAWRFEQGDLLRWPAPQRRQCEQLVGWPLVLFERTLCSAPLEASERAGLPGADLWLVRDSRIETLHLNDATPLNLGEWLNLDDYALLETFDCSLSLPPPVLQPLAVRQNIRQILGDVVGAPSADREEVMQSMAARRPTNHIASGVPPWVSMAALMALGVFGGLWLMLRGSTPSPVPGRSTGGTGTSTSDGAAADAQGIAPRRKPSLFSPGFLDRWKSRLANASRLNRLFGKRQAAYLQRMLDMFEEGDLQEALRHAIPLGDDATDKAQAFGTPQRRTDLELRQQQAAPSGIGLPDDFRDHLRKMYRATFEKLDREGRIDEAVFVLAELLKVRQEALDYLELHKRHQQCAELALAWDMAPAMIVRQLCLAGDWTRALQVARRDNAFADAVTSMEKKWPEQAKRLRLEWAESLAAGGHWLAAVDVIWPVPEHRSHGAQWLLSAEAGGERLAAEALVKRAILLPDTLQAYEPFLLELRDDPTRHAERSAIARALLAQRPHSSASSGLAAALAGSLIADQQLSTDDAQKLIKISSDPLLKADMPKLGYAPKRRVALREAHPACQWQAPAAGTRGIIDAVPQDDQRSLVALGESGALLLSAEGRVLHHFDAPAQHLVLAESRQVALALTRRGELWRVSKLDLANRAVFDLGVLAMDSYSRLLDGIRWTITQGDHVRVVDVDNGFCTLWHVDELPGRVLGIFADAQSEHWLINPPGGQLQRWRYRMPDRRLQARDELPLVRREASNLEFGLAGEPIEYWYGEAGNGDPAIVVNLDGRSVDYRLPGLDPEAIDWPMIHLGRNWMVVVYWVVGGHQQLRFFSRVDECCHAILDWPGREWINVRCFAGQWTAFDAQGRLFCLNVDDARPRSVSLY